MKIFRRSVFRREVAGSGELAVAPGADFLEVADLACLDEFADFGEVIVGVALGIDPSGDFALCQWAGKFDRIPSGWASFRF